METKKDQIPEARPFSALPAILEGARNGPARAKAESEAEKRSRMAQDVRNWYKANSAYPECLNTTLGILQRAGWVK